MKRLALAALLAAVPAVVFGSTTTHYIVRTSHPFDEAVDRLPREDFEPAVRVSARIRPFHLINGFDAVLTDEQVKRMIASGEVEEIDPVVERYLLDDAIIPGQQITTWGVRAVKAPDVWPVTKGLTLNGSGPIHVAIVDTGIDYHHPELKAAYKGGKNEVTGTDDPIDELGHGTHVAGIIAAADDNEGVVGVAPAVDLYAFKVFGACDSANDADVMQAIDDIVALKNRMGGNWIVNLSLGGPQSDASEQAVFQAAEAAGVMIVAAAGNSYDDMTSGFFQTDGLSYPAAYPGVLAVGAVDSTFNIAAYSQRGPTLSVVAPGGAEPSATQAPEILSTYVSEELATDDGRHYSVLVAGALKQDGTADPNVCIPAPNFSGSFVDCKLGQTTDFPASVRGKIALIERGNITFLAKVQNAKTAGATAVVFYDNLASDPTFGGPGFTETVSGQLPDLLPVVMLSQADGQTLLSTPSAVVSANFGFESWQLQSGTSMAAPHATGVVALAWAVAPNAAAKDVQNAVVNNATDLGDPGVDTVYGHGLVNALNAAKQLNCAAFGACVPPTGRKPGLRH